jgi:beta-glucosidase
MIDVLLGKVNPSGKLSETWPCALEDNPSYPYFPAKERTAEYREGLYIGYRYYDTAKIPVRYPFGHGMSYTTFRYTDLKADSRSVTFTLTNTGTRAGAEVAQVYVSCRNGKVIHPKKELKGFAKVFLKAGESRTVTVPLDDKAFRYFNTETNRWEAETANYDILVAASVSDVRLSTMIRICGVDGEEKELPSYRSGNIQNVSDAEFEELLGHPVPDSHFTPEITRNDAICQLYYAKSMAARLIYQVIAGLIHRSEKSGRQDLNLTFAFNMPLRALSKYGQFFSSDMVDDFVFLCNGHFFRGCGRLIRDFFKAQKTIRTFMKELNNP